MLTDKLLIFADNVLCDNTNTINPAPNTIEITGDEIARTLNIVAQLDSVGDNTDENTTITPAVTADGEVVCEFTPVSVDEAKRGKRLINFAKLPLGVRGEVSVVLTAGAPLKGSKWSAYLTPSCEA